MKEKNVILRAVVPAAVALLIFVGLVLAAEIEVNITPHHLSLTKGEVRFVRCYVNTTELAELEGESVIYTLGVGDDVVSSIQKLQHLHSDDDIMTIWFDLPEVRDIVARALGGETGEVALTLTITVGEDTFVGSDTIIVVD